MARLDGRAARRGLPDGLYACTFPAASPTPPRRRSAARRRSPSWQAWIFRRTGAAPSRARWIAARFCCFAPIALGRFPCSRRFASGYWRFAVKLWAAFGKGKRPWKLAKPALTGALVTALLFALFAGGAGGRHPPEQRAEDFLAWQNARIRLMDYTDFDTTTTDETLAEVGWSRKRVLHWSPTGIFMDDNITADAFDTLKASRTPTTRALRLPTG